MKSPEIFGPRFAWINVAFLHTYQNCQLKPLRAPALADRLEFRDFGVFETRIRAARDARNPRTLEQVHIPAKRTVKFKMGRIMKQTLGNNQE